MILMFRERGKGIIDITTFLVTIMKTFEQLKCITLDEKSVQALIFFCWKEEALSF